MTVKDGIITQEDLELVPFDPEKYLRDEETIAEYIQAATEEAGDDPAYIMDVLATVARARNMHKLASEIGLSRQGLYHALSNKGNPSYKTVAKLAKALGLKIQIVKAA